MNRKRNPRKINTMDIWMMYIQQQMNVFLAVESMLFLFVSLHGGDMETHALMHVHKRIIINVLV